MTKTTDDGSIGDLWADAVVLYYTITQLFYFSVPTITRIKKIFNIYATFY